MLCRLLMLTVVGSALATSAASADPGAVDRGFGRGGVVETGRDTSISRATPLPGGRLLLSTDALRGSVATLGQTGELSALTPPPSIAPFAVLPDGRFVTVTYRSGGDVIARRLPSGRADRSVGVLGALRLPRRSQLVAVGRDGRLAVVSGTLAAPLIRVVRADGSPDPGFGERSLPGSPSDYALEARRIAFDPRGRIVVVTKLERTVGSVQRLSPDGTVDPSFAAPPLTYVPEALRIAPSGRRILISDGDPSAPRPLLLDGDGREVALSPRAQQAIASAQVHVFDRQDRLVVSDGKSVVRISADGRRSTTLRRRLPGRAIARRMLTAAVDPQGRIVLAGYRLTSDAADPFEWCILCREDISGTAGLAIRLEGGVRRIALSGGGGGASVRVRCLAAARSRCTGTLTFRAVGERTVQRSVRLARGQSQRFAVPRGPRGRRRPVTADVRAFDATGELFTARRALRG